MVKNAGLKINTSFGLGMGTPALNMLEDDLKRLDSYVDKILPGITKKATEIMKKELQKEIKKQDLIDTEHLYRSIPVVLVRELRPVIVDVYVIPYYAHYLEYGTVNHRAYKFGRNAWTKAAPQIAEYIDQQLRTLTQGKAIRTDY